MATTKTFNNVRLQLKYDTLANWTSNNPILLAGEIAVTTVPAASGDVKQAPSVLMKVGDGVNHYNDLKFMSGLAANVHSWALEATKPVYAATEITGLEDFVNSTVVDTNTSYQIVKVNDYQYKLQSKELGGSWVDVAENGSIVIPKYDDTQVKADIAALETKVGTETVKAQIEAAIAALKLPETYDAKGAAAQALKDAKGYTDTLANGAVATNTAAIAAIKDGTTIDSFADVESQLSANAQTAAEATAQALKDAKDYADGKDAAIAAAKKAGDDAQADVDALKAKVGTVPENKTVVQMIADVQTAATYDDTEVRGLIQTNAEAISANKSDADTKIGQNKSAIEAEVTRAKEAEAELQKGIDTNAAAIETLTEGIDPEKVDGVKDLIKYVEDHGTEVTGMKNDIKTNADDIDALEGRATSLESRADGFDAAIEALQGTDHTHANKALLDTYTQTEANLADAVAKKHEHANASVLAGITAEKVADWDSAKSQVDALESTVGNVSEGKTVVEMISDAVTAAAEANTALETTLNGKIKTNADDIDALEGRATALEKDAVLVGDTLILNCGTSVIA